ncbi:hypothetical protein L2D01_09800 [Hyphomonadaceae bacterium ML37]|nr:hypothetical protein L2D01_09800 [Hyphomonadaceae bacterium ML37]
MAHTAGAALAGWAVRTVIALIAIPLTTLGLFVLIERENPAILSGLLQTSNWLTRLILNSPLASSDAALLTLHLSGAAMVFMLLMLAATVLVLAALSLARALGSMLHRPGGKPA